MQKFVKADPDSARFLKSPQAVVYTDAAPDWKSFFSQRIRWAGKSKYYSEKAIKRVMLVVFGINLCFVILTCLLFVKPGWAYLLLLFFIAKQIIEFPFVRSVSRFFGMEKEMFWFPLMQPFHIVYTVIAGFMGMAGSYSWKGRDISAKQTAAE